jgi:hypothetical protein
MKKIYYKNHKLFILKNFYSILINQYLYNLKNIKYMRYIDHLASLCHLKLIRKH